MKEPIQAAGWGSLGSESLRTSSLREDVLRLHSMQGSQGTRHLLLPSHPTGKSPKSLLAQGQKQPMGHAASCLLLLAQPFSLISAACLATPGGLAALCGFLTAPFFLSSDGYHYLHSSTQRGTMLSRVPIQNQHMSHQLHSQVYTRRNGTPD